MGVIRRVDGQHPTAYAPHLLVGYTTQFIRAGSAQAVHIGRGGWALDWPQAVGCFGEAIKS